MRTRNGPHCFAGTIARPNGRQIPSIAFHCWEQGLYWKPAAHPPESRGDIPPGSWHDLLRADQLSDKLDEKMLRIYAR